MSRSWPWKSALIASPAILLLVPSTEKKEREGIIIRVFWTLGFRIIVRIVDKGAQLANPLAIKVGYLWVSETLSLPDCSFMRNDWLTLPCVYPLDCVFSVDVYRECVDLISLGWKRCAMGTRFWCHSWIQGSLVPQSIFTLHCIRSAGIEFVIYMWLYIAVVS